MSDARKVGIHGIGAFVPDQVRKNEWWPEDVVKSWTNRHVWDSERAEKTLAALPTEGARMVMSAIAQHAGDPFQGAVERRVMPDGMSVSDMELAASREAISKADIDPGRIGVVLSNCLIPDHIGTVSACDLHHKLKLNPKCFSMTADAACNSFQMQLNIAEQMIRSGQADYALLVQTSAIWRTNPPEESFSIHFGDGSTAVIIGPVEGEKGLMAQTHRTDGSVYKALVVTVNDGNWWDNGRVYTQSLDRTAMRNMFLKLADFGKEVFEEALEITKISPESIDFFACHQASVWFTSVAQQYLGMKNAKTVDTYSWAGTLSGANLPLVLHTAEKEGLLKDGDLVAMYQGGTGMTYSATIMRWGK